MTKVLSFNNLVTPTATAFPSLSEAVDAGLRVATPIASEIRTMLKNERRDWFKKQSSIWPCISLTEGVNPTLRISAENPPQLLHGFAADYDSIGKRFTVKELTEQATRCVYPPTAAGASLSGDGVHAVWLFKEPIPVLGNADYARRVTSECYKNLRVANFVQGFDDAFKKPDRLLSIDPQNFGFVTDRGEAQVVDEVSTRLWASAVTVDFKFDGPALDLVKVYEIIQRRYPGRWVGDFVVGARGPRFWDTSASDGTASVVTPTGMVFFSNGGGFKSWTSLLGGDAVSKLNADSVSQVTESWHYDRTNREYVYACNGEYARKNRTQFCDRLELAGLEADSDRKRSIVYVEDYKNITAVVELANQRRGMIQQNGLPYLNATKTVPIVPTSGEHTFIAGLIAAMFGSEQSPYFLGWLQDAVRCSLACEPSYAQAVFLAGDVECGKSLLQYRIITPLLGGHSADPMGYLLGDTGFNSELADAGHWLVSDAEGAKNGSQRSSFTQGIKAVCANPSMSVHAKYCVPVTLYLNARLTFSFNKTAECLGVLPRLGEDLLGKICLFNIQTHTYFKGMDRLQIEAAIKAELSAFAYWLINEYVTPDSVVSTGRYRTKSYHSPELLSFARAGQDSSELLGWLNALFTTHEGLKEHFDGGKTVEFSAARWLQLITSVTGHHHSLSPNKLAAHFQQLAKQFDTCITCRLDPVSKLYLFGVNYLALTKLK